MSGEIAVTFSLLSVCVFRKNVSVFKKWGMFLFLYDIGRRGWTGEGYPAVALFAGLADAPSE